MHHPDKTKKKKKKKKRKKTRLLQKGKRRRKTLIHEETLSLSLKQTTAQTVQQQEVGRTRTLSHHR
jgi:hypothetical protein